ncbi:hypothetical protein EMIT019CA3_410003 [Bacillus pseudomycoides]
MLQSILSFFNIHVHKKKIQVNITPLISNIQKSSEFSYYSKLYFYMRFIQIKDPLVN